MLGPITTGTLDIETTASLFVVGTDSFNGIGDNLSPALDYNGDGLTEVAVSSYFLDSTIGSAVHLIPTTRRGSLTIEQAEFGRITGTSDDYFTLGGIMYGTSDIDGDHADDLLIGSPNAYRNGVELSGTLYHISGAFATNSTAATIAKTTFLGAEYDALSAVTVQDLDGDGTEDYVIGAALNAAGGTDAGAVYSFYGPLSGTIEMDQADVVQTGVAGELLGYQLETAEDMDGDGLADLWAAATDSSLAAAAAGAVYLLPATATSRDARANAIASLAGESAEDVFGFDVATLDMDADGNQDVLVGAVWQSQGGEKSGKAYLFYGPFAGSI
ncbi:MAG TPA: FG-GAP-like repeat-containing protein, partial [Myxococcota bacterium]|nr:FG-GAP-like repeat-containing protein [Myxococcota bacterium]